MRLPVDTSVMHSVSAGPVEPSVNCVVTAALVQTDNGVGRSRRTWTERRGGGVPGGTLSARGSTGPNRAGVQRHRTDETRLRLLDVECVAQWLGVEIAFVRRLVAERRIPFVKLGKYVRFDPDEVAGWLDAQRVGVERLSQRRRNMRD